MQQLLNNKEHFNDLVPKTYQALRFREKYEIPSLVKKCVARRPTSYLLSLQKAELFSFIGYPD